LLAEGRQVLLPRVASDTELTIHRYTSPADLQPGAFGILEPVGEPVDDCTIADAAIIPGMAFDRAGHRLGRGRGFYDRFLARVPQLLRIGLCAEWQLADFVPTDAHDVAMHYVVAVGAQSATLHTPHSTLFTPHSTLHIPHEKHSSPTLVAPPAGHSPRH
jgi:5-formyltetrahydrofolate cyclo-ligase